MGKVPTIPNLQNQKLCGVRSSNLCFNKSSWWFWSTLKFENQWYPLTYIQRERIQLRLSSTATNIHLPYVYRCAYTLYTYVSRYIHISYINVCAYIWDISDQICDRYVRYITHNLCYKLPYIYTSHTHYIHAVYTHMHTHRVLCTDFSQKFWEVWF